jgi:sterol desaturase/sphingolipid hydroxylase (fatty acid hydroxylase superfamily)
MDMTIWFIPVFVLMLGLEWASYRFFPDPQERGYLAKDAATSVSMGLGSIVAGLLFAVFSAWAMFFLYDHRIVDIPALLSPWLWIPLLVVLDDFAYYLFHRVSHTVRFMWAGHVIHHSSQYYNLSTALRQEWFPFLSLPFYLPLFAMGFSPAAWLTVHSLNLVYQFFIHTERVDKLWAPVEYVLNTPSHHRVHHGSNPQYIDKNYSGIFIVFDRWLGTFEAEGDPVVYGLTKNISTFNPFRVAFVEFAAMCRDVWHARSWRDRMGYLFEHPGWKPADAASRAAA